MITTRSAIVLVLFTMVASVFTTQWVITHDSKTGMVPSHTLASDTVSEQSVERATALINKLANGEVDILNHFAAGGDLIGFVVHRKGLDDQPSGLVYTDKSGEVLITGMVIMNKDGVNITERDFLRHIQPEQATSAFQTIAKTAFIEQGKADAKHKIYAVIDPNCPHCNTLYSNVQSMIEDGELAVRWIVAGTITPTSKSKALAILSASDPIQALKQNEEGFDAQAHSGGIEGVETPSLVVASKFKTNMDFVINNKLVYTPTMFYTTKDGVKRVYTGALKPEELQKIVASASDAF